jgi:hypothetical protein
VYKSNYKIPVGYFEADDGVKYKIFTTSSSLSYWNWWYMSFHDRNIDVDGFVDFWNLENLSSNGNTKVWASFLLFNNNTTYQAYDEFSLDFFLTDSTRTNVSIGGNYIKMLSPNKYIVFYESKNKEVSVNLTYDRLAAGISNYYEYPSLSNYKNYWLLSLSLAKVSGVINFKNSTFYINGDGYHDHNEGIVDWGTLEFIWGQMGSLDKNISIVFSNLYLTEDRPTDIIVLSDKSSTIKAVNTLKIIKINPNEYSIVGKNDHYQIELNITKKTSFLIEGGKHNLTVSYFSGRITKDNSVYEFRDVVGFFDEW